MTGVAARLALLLLCCLPPLAHAAGDALRVGSKRFTESYLLGEVLTEAARRAGQPAEHRQGLGNTAIVLNALRAGEIDVYAEYTGTVAKEILKQDAVPPLAGLNAALAPLGLAAGVPLGFNDSYALAVRADDARRLGLARLSDLRAHPALRLGLSQEFLGRSDGWPGLKRAYALPFEAPRGLDHGLAYEAIAAGQVDVIDVYTTDAKLERLGLTVLADDRGYFPRYDAVLLYRADLPQRLPATWAALARLEGRIDERRMRAMNAAAELNGEPFAAVARRTLDELAAAPGSSRAGSRAPSGTSSAASSATSLPTSSTTSPAARPAGFLDRLLAPDLARLTLEHLALVFASLAASVALGVPLGLLAARRAVLRPLILGATGIVQTIPALALLAFLIPLTGRIGPVPAFIALALYALLPIVRNTHAGLTQVAPGLVQAARSLGLRPRAVLREIELPLASPTLWAGVKTSAVINVGTATIAAFIGAGGYGERIVSGLALNDHAMLLAGAVPAAALALVVEALFTGAERWLVPQALRAG